MIALRSLPCNHPEVGERVRVADYFEKNAERMRYPKFRRQHLVVGSGAIEAGCKTVIGSRLKQSEQGHKSQVQLSRYNSLERIVPDELWGVRGDGTETTSFLFVAAQPFVLKITLRSGGFSFLYSDGARLSLDALAVRRTRKELDLARFDNRIRIKIQMSGTASMNHLSVVLP